MKNTDCPQVKYLSHRAYAKVGRRSVSGRRARAASEQSKNDQAWLVRARDRPAAAAGSANNRQVQVHVPCLLLPRPIRLNAPHRRSLQYGATLSSQVTETFRQARMRAIMKAFTLYAHKHTLSAVRFAGQSPMAFTSTLDTAATRASA